MRGHAWTLQLHFMIRTKGVVCSNMMALEVALAPQSVTAIQHQS